jgi:hypothetical protein
MPRIRLRLKMPRIRNNGNDNRNVADKGCLSRIQMFSIPDPESASKNLRILTQKIGF